VEKPTEMSDTISTNDNENQNCSVAGFFISLSSVISCHFRMLSGGCLPWRSTRFFFGQKKLRIGQLFEIDIHYRQ
jgi:hypothetical protein